MHQFTIPEICCLIVVTVGVVCDYRTMKIPNKLTFPAAAVGVILNAVCSSVWWIGALDGALGWVLAVAIMVTVAYLPIGISGEKLGMGDAKLMAAVGAFLGWKLLLLSFFYFCLSFGVVSAIYLARAVPWASVRFLIVSTMSGANAAPAIDTSTLEATRRKPIPAAVAIASGALLAILLEKQTIAFFFGGS